MKKILTLTLYSLFITNCVSGINASSKRVDPADEGASAAGVQVVRKIMPLTPLEKVGTWHLGYYSNIFAQKGGVEKDKNTYVRTNGKTTLVLHLDLGKAFFVMCKLVNEKYAQNNNDKALCVTSFEIAKSIAGKDSNEWKMFYNDVAIAISAQSIYIWRPV